VKPNVLLVTLDQFRGDCLSSAGHSLVKTPNLDAIAADGVRLARHYSQAAPCSPGRASLYTGMYQMNHRVLGNGSPLDRSFDNVALVARRAGYVPTLFGYTDQTVDPRDTTGPDDPRLATYEGVLPGFDVALDLTGVHAPWTRWLAERGHDISSGHVKLLSTEHERAVEHSVSSFLTDSFVDWLDRQAGGWFAHLSYLRPHPPYRAAGEFATMYDPADVSLPIPMADQRHGLHDLMLAIDDTKAPLEEARLRRMRSQYYGMVSEVDHQMGRVRAALEARGEWESTVVIVVSDHAELLGDHGLRNKGGFFEQSQHIVGIVRDPRRSARGVTVSAFTENVDILPTLCELTGAEIPLQCDGRSLVPFLDGGEPGDWRDAAHWEYDWSPVVLPMGDFPWPHDRRLSTYSLAVRRDHSHAYVQFGDGSSLCFDLTVDPTWRTAETRPDVVLTKAQGMLQWRMTHARRDLAHMVIDDGIAGRWPMGVAWRD
jgi:arylsulfatase A-like enzyme